MKKETLSKEVKTQMKESYTKKVLGIRENTMIL